MRTRLIMKHIQFVIISLIVLFILLPEASSGQFTHFSLDRNYGFLWPHKNEVKALQRGPYEGFELKAGSVLSSKDWHHWYRFPEIGLSYSYHNPGYPEILGYGHALSAYARIPYFIHPSAQLLYHLNFGIGYLTDKFDLDDNYYNIAIGSHFNIFGRLGIAYRQKISKHFYLKTGVALSHFSNTSIAKPNLGINLISGDIGIEYDLKEYPAVQRTKTKSLRYFEFSGVIAWSIKEIAPPGQRKYLTQSMFLNLERRVSSKYQVGIGCDFFYDGSLHDLMIKRDIPTSGFGDYLRNGVHISGGMLVGRVLFNLQVGRYLFVDYLPDGAIYNRLSLRTYLDNGMIINISLKSHYGRADFAEFGIGYAIKN